MFQAIIKRDGRRVPYDIHKIEVAIQKAMEAGGRSSHPEEALDLAQKAEQVLTEKFPGGEPGVEDIQDIVETVLMENGYPLIAK